jgi:hypothetical protein
MDYNKLNNPIQIDSKLLNKSNSVVLSNNIQKQQKQTSIEALLAQKIYTLTNFEKYKYSADLVKFLCNQLETLVSKNDGLDKKAIVINIMTKVFDLNEQEKELISDLVEFIYENKLIIQKGFNNLFSCLKKKF